MRDDRLSGHHGPPKGDYFESETPLSSRLPEVVSARRVVASIAVCVLMMVSAEYVTRAHMERESHQDLEVEMLQTAQLRSRLEGALNSTTMVATGLIAYIKAVESFSQEEINRVLRALYEGDDRIRNVGLAPGNVIRYIYPYEGNEAALGLKYESLPKQWPDVKRAIDMKIPVLAGPVDLVQGGRAVINRTPVFLNDGRYWGIVSTVIDIDKLLASVGLNSLNEDSPFALIGHQSNGHIETLAGKHHPDAAPWIQMRIDVPGGAWTLQRFRHVDPAAANQMWILRIGLYLLSVVVGVLTYLVLVSRDRATALADQLAQVNAGLQTANLELTRLSERDPLTGTRNRRSFQRAFDREYSAAIAREQRIGILMIDIDHFKSVNDRFGHQAGDATLIEVAAAIQALVRHNNDMVARYGGEEFVVLVVGAPVQTLEDLAERIRRAASQCRVQLSGIDNVGEQITISVGVASIVPRADGRPEDLLKQADDALYLAKRRGRNRVEFSDSQGFTGKQDCAPV